MRLLLSLAVIAALMLPATSIARAPHLGIADASPLTVKGAGFASHERIRVAVSLPSSTAHWTTASATGGFTVTFSAMSVDSCSVYVVHASGIHGDSAVLRVRPPECPQPLGP